MAAFRQWNWPLFAAHDTSSGTRESLQCRASPLSHDSGSARLFLGPGREREGALWATHAAAEALRRYLDLASCTGHVKDTKAE